MRMRILALFLLVIGLAAADTATFTAVGGGNDGYVYYSGSTWPPGETWNYNTSDGVLYARYDKLGTLYYYYVSLIRFDTSSLPNDATVTSASLTFYVTSNQWDDGAANFHFSGAYYASANWPIDIPDYAAPGTVGTNAFNIAATTITNNATNTIALSNLTNISLTGYTALRMGIYRSPSNTAPAGINRFYMNSGDATSNKPVLTVTYTVPTPTNKAIVIWIQ